LFRGKLAFKRHHIGFAAAVIIGQGDPTFTPVLGLHIFGVTNIAARAGGKGMACRKRGNELADGSDALVTTALRKPMCFGLLRVTVTP
jgi:hypothetical protein